MFSKGLKTLHFCMQEEIETGILKVKLLDKLPGAGAIAH